jgi:hypothetical protein
MAKPFTSTQSLGSRALALLPATTITTAVAGVAGTSIVDLVEMGYLGVVAVFTYGSGGTTAKFWVQTSFDLGVTWVDVMSFAFATATATKFSAVKKGIAVAGGITPSDATLADNTILDGVLGDRLRVKYTTVGTYAGGTTIAINGISKI